MNWKGIEIPLITIFIYITWSSYWCCMKVNIFFSFSFFSVVSSAISRGSTEHSVQLATHSGMDV